MTKIIKAIGKAIWTFSLQKGWNWIWGKTQLDEKVKEKTKDLNQKFDRIKEESKDVVEAVKEVKNQVKDVTEVVKTTTKRRGRPRKNEKKA